MASTCGVTNLFDSPRWAASDLGRPIPDSPHAVSAALPRWADVVGYEEREPRVIEAMAGGYPRFVCHRACQRLFAELAAKAAHDLGAARRARAFDSPQAAQRFAGFLRRRGDASATVLEDQRFAAHYDPRFEDSARAFWQHTGEGISSRAAEAWLNGEPMPDAPRAKAALRRRIADLAGVDAGDVWLASTGMAAMFTLRRALARLYPDRPSVQFGFPYVDTLKVLQTFGGETVFHPRGDDAELDALERSTAHRPPSGIYTELPSNPLLRSPDLERLAAMTRRSEAPLIIDDTLATWLNVDLAGVADATWSSLTKYFSGVGDVTGGCLIIRPESPQAARLREAVEAEWVDGLCGADAELLERNSRDFVERMPGFNANAAALADHLADHPAVGALHYPGHRDDPGYRRARRAQGGYGGLLSFEMRQPTLAPAVYDRLRVNKGPNLGANYTLACPFTLLAHYDELDWAESCGVSRWLIRVSVGLEPISDLKDRFDEALAPS